MEDICIMLRYNGFWVTEKVYETTSVDGIVVPPNVSYDLLQEEIANHIGIDLLKSKMRLRYMVDSSPVPMEIRNNMGVMLYMRLKKKVSDFERYPLCVDIVDVSEGVECSNGGEDTTSTKAAGTVDCRESVNNCRALVLHDDADGVPGDGNFVITDTNQKSVEVGQTFIDKQTLILVMHRYALEHRFQFHATRSNPDSYVLDCYVENCSWHFRASKVQKSNLFKVRTFNNVHTCPLAERGFSHRQASSRMVAALCIQQLKSHKRRHSPSDIKHDILINMGIEISYNKAWRAKELALKIIMGKPADDYKELPRYLYVLGCKYPGSCIRYHKNDANQFMYLFIALNVSISGFNHCRPVVVVDGSQMKGPYLGTFISASTLDGAGNILPLAYGVVDSENDASWAWFFTQFREAFGVRPGMAIVSDRHDSIWKSVEFVFPEIPHYACVWHLWRNVCKIYRKSQDTLTKLYYDMAKSYRCTEFEELMAKVDRIDSRVKRYLLDVGYEKWARSYAPTNRGRITTSNMAECINGCLVDARKLNLLAFLEKVRELFAKWNQVNGDKARYMSASRLGDKFEEILTINEIKSRRLTAVKSSDVVYSMDDGDTRYIVCLQDKTCSCDKFQYDELPCAHAITVLRSKCIEDLMPYCSDYYKKATLEKIYEDPFPPMPLRKEWTAPEKITSEIVLPPAYKRPPGRTKIGRVRSKGETLRSCTNCCGRCGRTGHNRRRCAFFPKEK